MAMKYGFIAITITQKIFGSSNINVGKVMLSHLGGSESSGVVWALKTEQNS